MGQEKPEWEQDPGAEGSLPRGSSRQAGRQAWQRRGWGWGALTQAGEPHKTASAAEAWDHLARAGGRAACLRSVGLPLYKHATHCEGVAGGHLGEGSWWARPLPKLGRKEALAVGTLLNRHLSPGFAVSLLLRSVPLCFGVLSPLEGRAVGFWPTLTIYPHKVQLPDSFFFVLI